MGSCAKCCVWLFLVVVADSVLFTLGESTDDILRFLELYEKKMVFDPKHKDVVLVFGNTGAGKTAFTQWIAGDSSKLFSVEKDPGNFIIVDNNRIGNSTVQSKTTFPELVVDKETETAYYDTSGFGDTRGVKNNIATSYFIKRIIDHVDTVKILLVTDYESVRNGGHRKDFLKLLQHIVELIKNTDRYTAGVGLVVTKVPNLYSRGKLVSDDAIVQSITNFLDNAMNDIAERYDLDEDVRQKIVHLIYNIINQSNADSDFDIRSYGMENKIMLFRRPDDTGPLSLIPAFQIAKQRVRTIISEHLRFISKHKEDFCYTVSDETKYKLHNLIDVLKESLEENVKDIVLKLKNHYDNKINMIEKNIQSTDIQEIDKAESELIKVQNIENEVKDGVTNMFTLASDIKNTKRCKDIAIVLKNIVNRLNITLPKQIMSNLESKANFLEFIDEASILSFKLETNLLQLSIQETATQLKQSSINVKQSIDRFIISIEEYIHKSFRHALTHVAEYISQTERTSSDLAEIKAEVYKFSSKLNELQDTSNVELKKNILYLIFKLSNTKISDQVLQKITYPKYFPMFTTELNHFVQSLNGSLTWYEFLDKLYNELSSYNVQNSNTVQSHCKSFVQSSVNYRGRNVEDTNIGFILQDCSETLYKTEYNQIKNVNLTQHNVDVLKKVVDFTLNNNGLSQYCIDSKLVVKGRLVKISEVLKLKTCIGKSTLEIIGLEKVFFDTDINFTGLNINLIIMAPHWVILGDRKIILDGKPGELIQPVKAKEGQDGRPGMPGGNAGNFLGYGDKITNSEKLFISANGGNGSPGQAGGDGKPGRDGAVPEIKYNSLSYYWMTEPEPHDNVVDWQSRNFMVYSGNRYSCDILLTVCRNYKVIGTSCSDGGDGGRGGVGGEGGTAGVVRVPQIEFRAKNGNNGVPGAHGIGGAAGKYSATISVHERRECYITYKTKYYSQTGITYHQCNSGKAQQGVYNSVGMRLRSSSESNILDDRKFSPAIGDFKAYLQQNINKTYRKQYLLNILSQVHF